MFLWPVTLPGGTNTVSAIGTLGSTTVTDSLVWITGVSPPPAAPTSLVATGGNAVVNLTWVQSASAGITTNNVYRSTTGSGGPYGLLTSLAATTSYADTAVVNGSNYFYTVTAVSSSGESAMSGSAGATPFTVLPAAPTSLVATGGNAVVNLTWVQSAPPPPSTNLLSQGKPVTASGFQAGNDPSHGNDGSLATRWAASDGTYNPPNYQWWRVDLGSTQNITQADIFWYNSSTRAYQYKIEISSNDTTYSTLVDKTGNTTFGDTTNNFSATTRYVRITVTGTTASGGFASFYECQIYGLTSSPGVTTNKIYRSTTGSGGPYSLLASLAATTSYADMAVVNGSNYYYTVTAVSSGGESAMSGFAGATPFVVPPSAPTSLVATAGDTVVNLTWVQSISPGITTNNVYRSTTGSGGPYGLLASLAAATSYADMAVVDGSNYFYAVTAVSTNGESAMSGLAGATPLSAFQSWQLRYFGCTNSGSLCVQAAPSADPYGKGINNFDQFLLGLNPTNPASVFRILSVVPQSNDMVITWATGGGSTNVVQATSGDVSGNYLTNFTDISGPIAISGSGDATTNYLDSGALPNSPERYYRIRLPP
jgi:fibronectin type 3 domain-containing protein